MTNQKNDRFFFIRHSWAATILLLTVILLAPSCSEDDPGVGCDTCTDNDLIGGDYEPEPFVLDIPDWLPSPIIPLDNPLTVEGVELGRRLFYDPILSSDGSMSCASCHRQDLSFSDESALSTGVLGMEGTRNSMALVNLAFNPNGFFWDGRSATLEEQVLIPVEDHVELNENWDNVVKKLRDHERYPQLFREAFGIARKSEIDKHLVAKAIAQFERTLISGNSRFDRVVWLNDGWFTEAELRGKQLFFFEELQNVDHPGCSHCHFDPLFADNNFKNNGLDDVDQLEDFSDPGRGAVTNNRNDLGKFRVPTLRNIALTAPYMHDGRFQTLEEVLDHYAAGGHNVENEDANIHTFVLSDREKQDLIAFLNTLTDTSFVQNPAFSNPFQ